MYGVTYVSCFVNINCKEPHKTHQWRMDNFLHIANTGVPIVLYVDAEIKEAFKDTWSNLKNVVLKDVDYQQSWTYKVCAQYKDWLPSSRNQVKDSFLFLCLMNMKIEFVVNAVNDNPFSTTHFAWIDFNLAHIFKDKPGTSSWMHSMAKMKYAGKFIANPGCWPKGQGMESIVDNINWRFCGGFMIGDGESFNELFDLYLSHFTTFMHRYRHITWEVNFWAWLEVNADWNIVWYKADHDDSIVKLPSHLFSSCLREKAEYVPLIDQLPKKPGYFPMSSCFIEFEQRRILNVRYVNYRLDPFGRYMIEHPEGHLETLNLRCYLSEDLRTVEYSEFMWDGMMQLREYDKSIRGLEDIRLYEFGGQLKYVATNKSYHPGGKIRIMTGDYNDTMAMFENGVIMEPPTDTYCEKNWIPLGGNVVPPNPLLCFGNRFMGPAFIYQWSPFQIGVLEGCQLKIVKNIQTKLPFKVRGSTTPIRLDDGSYVCVVHYCEHGQSGLLEYYHLLVMLNQDMEPTQWSNVFHFNKVGIQYCIGFCMRDGKYYFWFSEHDSNPGLMIIEDKYLHI